jgi:L-alanine-DL-glutamate epimerase-like enolase superfamily enzyme
MRGRSVSTAVVEANFDWTIIRIEDEDGRVGWGESFFAPGLTGIVQKLSELVVGEDVGSVVPLMRRLVTATSGAGSVGGIVHNALSGIDAALWDLLARTLNTPLWQLLGGRFRDRVRLYADCHSGSGLMSLGPLLQIREPRWSANAGLAQGQVGRMVFDPGAEAERVQLDAVSSRVRDVVQGGFDAIKLDLDVPGLAPTEPGARRIPRADAGFVTELAAAAREGAGLGVELAFDCHWRFDLASAMRIAEACEKAQVLWLEDPLPPENVAGLVELSRRTSVPLASGENLYRWAGFAPLIDHQAVAVVTPDLAKVRGLAEARRIADAADERGLAVAPHNIAGPVGTMFAAQVASTWPNFVALEFYALDVPFFNQLVDESVVTDGAVRLSSRPGIGVDVVEDEVARWAKRGEGLFDSIQFRSGLSG